jgi:hypothetical protein
MTEIPEKFLGKFKHERSENFEEYLASRGNKLLQFFYCSPLKEFLGFFAKSFASLPSQKHLKNPQTSPGNTMRII